MSNDDKSDKTEHKLCFLFNKVIDLGRADFNPSAASNESLTESNDPNAARARDPELPKTPDAYKEYISSSEDLIDSLEKAKKDIVLHGDKDVTNFFRLHIKEEAIKEQLKKKYEKASQAFAKKMSEDKIRREFKDMVKQKAEEIKKNEAMKKEEQFAPFMGRSRESMIPTRTDNETYRRESAGRDRQMITPTRTDNETYRRESTGRDQELGGDKPTLLFDEIQIRESAIGCQNVRDSTRRFGETQIKESAISSQDVRERGSTQRRESDFRSQDIRERGSTQRDNETQRRESAIRSQDIRERGSAISCQDVRESTRKFGETHKSESDFRSQDIRKREPTRRLDETQRRESAIRSQDIRERGSTQRDSETQRSEATNQMLNISDIDFFIMEIKQIFKDDRASKMANTEIDTLYRRTFKIPIRKDWLQVLEKHEDFEVLSTGITTLWIIRLIRANESKL